MHQFRKYEPARHLAIRCFLDNPKGQRAATALQYHSLLPVLPLQAFIETFRNDPDFKKMFQEFLGFKDTDQFVCLQVEIPNELLVSLSISRWATDVHSGHTSHPSEVCGRSILASFVLPWTPGTVYIHVRVNRDLGIVRQILTQLFRFNSIGREYKVLEACEALVLPPETVIPTVFEGEWVTITEGPYTNDIAFVQCVVGQSQRVETMEVPYPMASVRVIPRLCDTCHNEEQLGLGLEASLCKRCRLTRPEPRRRRDSSLSHRRSEGLAWNGVNVVSGFATVTIPLQHLDVCSFVPLSVYNAFREPELETQSTSEWSFRAARGLPPDSSLQEPLLPTTVLRPGQPVLIVEDMYLVADFPDTDASSGRTLVGVIPETIVPESTIGVGRVPLQVNYEDVVSFPPLCCVPLFDVSCQVKVRRGKRMDKVYVVEDIDYDELWLTLKGDDHFIKTRDWHNYQSISGNHADLEMSLINHRPPIYISPPLKDKVSHWVTMLRLIGWDGKIVRITFPASSAVHGQVGDFRKQVAKGRQGQIMSATETHEWEEYPSGVCVLVEIQGAVVKTQVWMDAYELIDVEAKTPVRDDDPDDAAFWQQGVGTSSNVSDSTVHPSEVTLPGFEALHHPKLRNIPLSLKYKHQGPATVDHWLIYEASSLKKVHGVIVIDQRSPQLGVHMTTLGEDKERKAEEAIGDDGIYVFACKTADLPKQDVKPPVYSISSHALCVSGLGMAEKVEKAIGEACKRSKKKETTIIRL
ncbi:hypothetical protein DL96DRAFT_1804637 [Flagelloscypha sp. PMI_526]|nr:hypothetical protein DL96DRAFT_1804637 [Flagelloscypha sp. PMI_526]